MYLLTRTVQWSLTNSVSSDRSFVFTACSLCTTMFCGSIIMYLAIYCYRIVSTVPPFGIYRTIIKPYHMSMSNPHEMAPDGIWTATMPDTMSENALDGNYPISALWIERPQVTESYCPLVTNTISTKISPTTEITSYGHNKYLGHQPGPTAAYCTPPQLSSPSQFDPFAGQMTRQRTDTDVCFRVETKRVFVCAHGTCNKRYARVTDLKRHHRGVHQGNDQFKCRTSGCPRTIRGFSRRDKRDSHEKSMHMSRIGGFVG